MQHETYKRITTLSGQLTFVVHSETLWMLELAALCATEAKDDNQLSVRVENFDPAVAKVAHCYP